MLTFLGYKGRYFISLKTSIVFQWPQWSVAVSDRSGEQLLVKLKIWTVLRSND